MSTQDAYEEYYVPHNSKLPIFASLGIFLTLYGMGNMFNEMSAGLIAVLGDWSSCWWVGDGRNLVCLVQHSHQGKSRKALQQPAEQSFVWGMSWFIFSEVMFFAAFFGALFYVRVFVVDWIGGVGDRGPSNMLWPDYEPHWPCLIPEPEAFSGRQGTLSLGACR